MSGPSSDMWQRQQQILPIMTTEHFTLQTARSATIADSSSRASMFLATLSTALVALAFIGQLTRLGQGLFIFGLVVFPTLFFLGLVTFERVLQSGAEDVIYAREINRIRHWYLECAPEVAPYFILSTHDDDSGVLRNMAAMRRQWWQVFLTIAGMVAVINSVILGVIAAFAVHLIASGSLAAPIIAAFAVFLPSVWLHQRYQGRQWARVAMLVPPLFPGEGTEIMARAPRVPRVAVRRPAGG